MKTSLALDYAAVLANTAQPVHLALTFDAPSTVPSRPQPVAFVVVLDRSGSMGGHPLDAAKRAAESVVRNLRPGDWFGMVVFDSVARTIIPLADRRDLSLTIRTIHELREGDMTNLTGGWSLGRDLLAGAPNGCPRKLLLLTDGMANTGITEPQQVTHLVAQACEHSRIRTSCLGFGDDYSEDLLRELATATGGELHDANNPDHLPEIFTIELEGLQSIAVQNLRVTLTPSACVDRLRLLGAYPDPVSNGSQHEFAIGDLVSDEQRVVVFALAVLPIPLSAEGQPVASWEGEKLLDLSIQCDVITPAGIEIRQEKHCVNIRPVQDAAEVNVNVSVISWVSLLTATVVVDQAIALRDQGGIRPALDLLQQELDRLAQLPSSPLLEDARKLLQRALVSIRDDEDYTRSRKVLRSVATSYSRTSSHESSRADPEDVPSFKRRRPETDESFS